ncbi:ATP-binding cassette sub-family A member 3 [Nephila pilipes]|uniref:ATP-binding cassette sub-family A member 3 n=1 Tax=Nephila pilipes TaxID=299642 RepID=A0A8X6MGG2_NEPPI|nr:ATP-binding cassette sub-family A member 3 [Nephila pilipes]
MKSVPSYWFGVNPKSGNKMKLVNKSEKNIDFFEEEPSGATPSIIIQNLCKEFGSGLTSKVVVNDVSLNIYQGKITALLGQNGVGKTTIISTLAGLYPPTSGCASINGLDILTDTVRARRSLGVCPQHNVLYDTLTVEEHLKIYAAMKGVVWRNINEEVTRVLNIVKLAEQRAELSEDLSGGMKRKLSLGIAIIGGSKVLFLDEPTSGMDVEARRSVWDALLEIRHSHTIILITHYMEEADVLGDRIAIMAEGEIRCSGSPMFLKQKFGAGYHLHVVKDSNFEFENIFSLLKKYIPEVKVGREFEKEISFKLSSNSGCVFADMFEELENQKQKLGVSSFGVTITTMEDVFLNVANLSDMKYKLHSESEQSSGVHRTMEDVYGDSPGLRPHPKLHLQFFGLVLKRIHYFKRHWSFLVTQLAIPFLLICACLQFLRNSGSRNQITYDPLKLDISSVYGDTDGFIYNKNPQLSQMAESLKNVLKSNEVNVIDVDNPTHYVLDYCKKGLTKYLKNIMVGGAFDQNRDGTLNLTAWFNGEPYHAIPMSLLLMHTAVLKHITNTGSITLINEPFPEQSQIFSHKRMETSSRHMSIIFMPLAFGFLSASYVLVPIYEKVSKSKLLQLMTGVPAMIYWIAMFVWDYILYMVSSILLIIPFAIFVHYVFFGIHLNAMGTALLMMLLYGWASIPFSYLIAFLFDTGNTGFSAVVAFCVLFDVCQIKDKCLVQKDLITWDAFGCGRDLLFLFIDGWIYFFILFLVESRFMATFSRAAKAFMLRIRKSVGGLIMEANIVDDSNVFFEEERIRNLMATYPGSNGEALVVSDLSKVYRNFYAVKQLTFGVHPEECFGILGVNGAGKTTTFRMLTGDTFPTHGNAYISSSSIKTDLKRFQSYLGYCPQFDALIDRLTGREMLSLFARLRGLTGYELHERVEKMIKMTDLTAHADKETQFYSGGNKRKLSVALSLIGSPPLILLDEPTAGVDPVSRRKIWNILSQARNDTGAAVILTTHNMEESEVLCNRLAIMVNGRFRCLGSIQQLKTKYGKGYTVIIKMKRKHQYNQKAVNMVKTYVQSNLAGANLKDDHQDMLQYHVDDPSITLSHLFKFMTNMKNQFDLEDYFIRNTSLEEIFLTFARAQRVSY